MNEKQFNELKQRLDRLIEVLGQQRSVKVSGSASIAWLYVVMGILTAGINFGFEVSSNWNVINVILQSVASFLAWPLILGVYIGRLIFSFVS